MKPSFDAYYYSFEATGDQKVDAILEAVAAAGKAYHHTDEWYDGGYIDRIQGAANEAALAAAGTDQPPWEAIARSLQNDVRDLQAASMTPEEADHIFAAAVMAEAHADTPEWRAIFWNLARKYDHIERTFAKRERHEH